MSDSMDDRAADHPPENPAPPPTPPAGGRGPERAFGGGDRRRKRGGSAERRAEAGFGDGVERAFCIESRHFLPQTFPVQSRIGVAVIRPFIVARRPDAMLLCEGEHAGPHVWPDGTPVPPRHQEFDEESA